MHILRTFQPKCPLFRLKRKLQCLLQIACVPIWDTRFPIGRHLETLLFSKRFIIRFYAHYQRHTHFAAIKNSRAFTSPAVFIFAKTILLMITSAVHVIVRSIFIRVKSGIECIEVLAVQLILRNSQRFTESLIMNNLTFSQEFDGFADIRFFDQPEDVIICAPCLLLCRHRYRNCTSEKYCKMGT